MEKDKQSINLESVAARPIYCRACAGQKRHRSSSKIFLYPSRRLVAHEIDPPIEGTGGERPISEIWPGFWGCCGSAGVVVLLRLLVRTQQIPLCCGGGGRA